MNAELKSALMQIGTHAELKEIYAVLKDVSNNITLTAARQFKLGDKVEWTSTKYGGTVKGKITRINTKTISVTATNHQKWTVSPGMLKIST